MTNFRPRTPAPTTRLAIALGAYDAIEQLSRAAWESAICGSSSASGAKSRPTHAVTNRPSCKISTAAANAGIRSLTTEVVGAFNGREACTLPPMMSGLNGHPNASEHRAFAQFLADAVPAAAIRATDTMPSGDGDDPQESGGQAGE